MKKLLSFLALLALALGAPAPASAATKPTASDTPTPAAAPSPTAGKSRPFPFHGDVTAVDSAAKTFTLKNKVGSNERVFHVGENTKPSKDGWSGDFSAISVGVYATGTCTKTGDHKFEVATLHIGSKSARKAASTPKAAATPKPASTPKPS